MAERVDALANSVLLSWARRTAGFDLGAAAKKIPVSRERLESWENGEAHPTIKQLGKLANAYKRPIAVFYLPEPPRDFQALRDFRRLPDRILPPQSPALLFSIRRARDRRELAIDLLEASGDEPPPFGFAVTLEEDPEDVAKRIREFLGIRLEDQVRWKPDYDTFNHWRAALESAGVFVFQAAGVDVKEIRGFSIYSDVLPAAVVNMKDSIRGRSFTLLHEFTHIALNQAGICDLTEARPQTDEQLVEVFCNQVAGATLLPREALLAEPLVSRNQDPSRWQDADIRALSDRYGVSREVVLRRLLITGRATNTLYEQKREELLREYAEMEERGRKGFAPPHRVAIVSAGPTFVKLVLDSYRQDTITAGDVADFLGVRLKHIGRIESEVAGFA